jgi:hypothetical protein
LTTESALPSANVNRTPIDDGRLAGGLQMDRDDIAERHLGRGVIGRPGNVVIAERDAVIELAEEMTAVDGEADVIGTRVCG